MKIHAEVTYVTDEVKIGLHKEPSKESPIIKLVPSGTKLNVIERENDLIHVEEPEGVRGWGRWFRALAIWALLLAQMGYSSYRL